MVKANLILLGLVLASMYYCVMGVTAEQVYAVECVDSYGTIYTMEYSAVMRYDLTEEIYMCGTDDWHKIGE